MFKTFFTSELRYVLKQPTIYIYIAFFILIEFLTIANNAGAADAVYRNAPFVITRQILQLSFIGLLIVIQFFSNAALRDYKNEFNEILFTTPLHKSGYFFGRFFAVLLVATLPFIGAYIGFVLGSLSAPLFGWGDTSRFGPFYLETFVNNYFFFVLPNMFITGGIVYAIASKWKTSTASFIGILGIIVTSIISSTFMSDIGTHTLASLTDIFGINLYNVETRYYTALEKNTISPTFSGLTLWNRVLWIGLSSIILLASYATFSFKKRNEKLKRQKNESAKREQVIALESVTTVYNRTTPWIQFKSFFLLNFLSVVKSGAFKIILFFSASIIITGLSLGFENLGLKVYPLTYQVIDNIQENQNIFVVVILIFFSGELVWRDRDSKISEVIDATAHTSFISMAAKTLSLISIVSILHLSFIAVGIAHQLLSGFSRIELDVYLLDFLYNSLPQYAILGCITVLIQVVINKKYLGHFVSIIVLFVLGQVLALLGLTTNMLQIAGGPSIEYSDLNSFGPGLTGALWFNTYWLLFSALCLIIAGSLWNRGPKNSLLGRIKIARKQMPKSYRGSIAAIMVMWLAVAGNVYYNTQIVNPTPSLKTVQQFSIDYEKKYKQYENATLPKITEVKYYVDIFPSERDIDAKILMTLTNEHEVAIDTLHFIFNNGWNSSITVPNSSVVSEDKVLLYNMYKLNSPLQPGESVQVSIDTEYRTKGFENNRGNTNIVRNGTMINFREFLPVPGYDARYELNNNALRRENGLPYKTSVPKLVKEGTAGHMKNQITNGKSGFINVETIISTSSDQTAIAPGSLVRQWKEEGRNYYHFKTDTPSLNYHTFNSGKYEVAKRQWNDVSIEVYYDKKHPTNIEMMIDAVERSLTYYTKNFGPYYHKQFRVIEVPRYVRFGGQAFPGTILYNERAGFITNLEDETKNNLVYAVIAHELGHQWWAHQVIGANMQGSTMLSESLAEYSTLMTLKEVSKTPMDMREFLQYDHDLYLRGRSNERVKESPLYKVESQVYVRYGKGSIVLYALQDYIGEEKVNTALKGFLKAYRYKEAPYPSSLNFIEDYLVPQVPDSLEYLIKDWFYEITLYDNLLKSSTYEELENGRYALTLDIESYKVKADSIGNESRVAMNDWIDIGFFLDDEERELYYQQRVKINQGLNTFTFELDSLPVKAAIDPRHIFIDKNYSDNIRGITKKE